MSTAPKKQSNTDVPYYQEPKHATTLLWIGVILVSIFVMALWAISAQSFVLDTLRGDQSQEGELFQAVQNDFNVVIDSATQRDDAAISEAFQKQVEVHELATEKKEAQILQKKEENEKLLNQLISTITETTGEEPVTEVE